MTPQPTRSVPTWSLARTPPRSTRGTKDVRSYCTSRTARPSTPAPRPAARLEGGSQRGNDRPRGQAAAIRDSIRHDRPSGSEMWVRALADLLGLGSSLRARVRPRIKGEGEPGTG